MMETWRLLALSAICLLSFPAGLLCGWKIHKYHVEAEKEQKAIAEACDIEEFIPTTKPTTPEEKVNMYERLVSST